MTGFHFKVAELILEPNPHAVNPLSLLVIEPRFLGYPTRSLDDSSNEAGLSHFKFLRVASSCVRYYDLFCGCGQSQPFFISYSPIHITTCFGLYRPSSGEIYTDVFKSCHSYNGSVFRLYSPLFQTILLYHINVNL
jgi:hypothetical protein